MASSGSTGVIWRWLFPGTCAGCGASAEGVCASCLALARRAPVAPPPPGVDRWVAAFAYEGVVREAVAGVKYRNDRAALATLAGALARVVAGQLVPPDTVVTWVPATIERRRASGFDHGALLARAVARALGLPCLPLLRRLDGRHQTGAPLAERRAGPVLGPGARRRRAAGGSVLVVDDVATSGATLAAAARVLRGEGYETVIGATVARTPLKGDASGPDTATGGTVTEGDRQSHARSHQCR